MDISGQHHLAATDQIDNAAQAVKGKWQLSSTLAIFRMSGIDLVYQLLAILCHVRQLTTVTCAHVLTSRTQPEGVILEVRALLLVEMPAI